MILNGKEYKVPRITKFEDLIDLEERGINIIGLTMQHFVVPGKILHTVIKGISFYTGLTEEEARKELCEHIDSNGGSLEEVMESLEKDIEEMQSFGAKEGFSKGTKVPQDHKKPQKKATVTPIQ